MYNFASINLEAENSSKIIKASKIEDLVTRWKIRYPAGGGTSKAHRKSFVRSKNFLSTRADWIVRGVPEPSSKNRNCHVTVLKLFDTTSRCGALPQIDRIPNTISFEIIKEFSSLENNLILQAGGYKLFHPLRFPELFEGFPLTERHRDHQKFRNLRFTTQISCVISLQFAPGCIDATTLTLVVAYHQEQSHKTQWQSCSKRHECRLEFVQQHTDYYYSCRSTVQLTRTDIIQRTPPRQTLCNNCRDDRQPKIMFSRLTRVYCLQWLFDVRVSIYRRLFFSPVIIVTGGKVKNVFINRGAGLTWRE